MDPAPQVERTRVPLPEAGHCAVHAEREVFANCRRCGDFICRECTLVDSAPGRVCTRCVERDEPLVRRGRRIARGVSVAAFANVAIGVAFQASLGQLGAGHIARVAVYGWLCWHLSKGSSRARKAFLLLVAFGIVVTAAAAMLAGAEALLDVAVFVTLGALIAFPRSVRSFFDAPRPYSDLRG